ncbi:presequence protease, mitochondrial [Bombina bombina]|uniref:presequence protease, mitochondrial n=1 Tax=Bombina bombina TaxID=8345 RepID=UPI00235AFC5E|nr:presequence protease, mitochondrial [Bombina bombina]
MIRQWRAGRLLSRALYQNSWRWKSNSASERALQYKVGERIHGFTVNEVTSVPDLFLTAVKLNHETTGAKYLHIAREDSNNLFSVQFRTTPMDSTGVPHILEHTVLCGSQKYPCRDPFFKMLNRSLSTFMNAFTASDYTMYPFSTQNPKDFQNLLSVYLDAVFFPCLRELDFWQEGWRLEHENPTDPNSPLIFKGIVFNEMKGAFTDNEKVFSQYLQNKLLPDHTYAVVSGGEPLNIPDLTWEQLRQFHATHYHPSNARFFTYGNFPLEMHLKQIHEDALRKFERIDVNTAVPLQERWRNPRSYHATCGEDSFASDPAKQTTVSISFLLSEMGCGVYNYREQAQQMELTTGGMSVCPHIVTDDSSLDSYEQGVLFSSLCLERNLPDMMHLWSEIFLNPHFDDEERLRVLVRMSAQEMSNGIPDSGHTYASIRASRTLTPAGDLHELFSGMDQVKMMKRIAEMPDMSGILRKLSRIRKYILLSDSIRCSVNATPQQMSSASKEIEHFLLGIHRNKKERKAVRPHVIVKSANPSSGHEVSPRASRKLICEPTFKPCQMKTHFSLPFPVNYIGECVRTVPYTDADYASLRILARVLTAKFLHGEIREKGGAYGGGAKLGFDGIFNFYSYRDPNCLSTLSVFEKAIDWARSGKFAQEDIDEAKLSVFSSVDSPVAPSDKGMNNFLHGVSDEMKQKHREQLFAVTHSDLINVTNKYLTVGHCTHGTAILGPENINIAKDPTWIIR